MDSPSTNGLVQRFQNHWIRECYRSVKDIPVPARELLLELLKTRKIPEKEVTFSQGDSMLFHAVSINPTNRYAVPLSRTLTKDSAWWENRLSSL